MKKINVQCRKILMIFEIHGYLSYFIIGCYEKMCIFLTLKNFAKSYFRKGHTHSKTQLNETMEVTILRNVSKINILGGVCKGCFCE